MVSSHAAACAKLFDIPLHIVERANFVTEALGRFDIDAILRDPEEEGEGNRMEEAGEERELEELAGTLIEWDLDEMEAGRDGCDVEEIRERLIEMLDMGERG
jgi:DNA mismatch repair protein MSH5